MHRWVQKTGAMWRTIFRKAALERDLEDELRFHLEMLTAKYQGRGLSRQEAQRVAQLQLGGVEQVKERVREGRMGHFLETLWRDWQYGARMLRKNPGFAISSVLTLAIGIGACTAIFSYVNFLILRPFPFPELDELVFVYSTLPQSGANRSSVSPADFVDWKSRAASFVSLEAYRGWNATRTGEGDSEQLRGYEVTTGWFSLFDFAVQWGRTFHAEEHQPGRSDVVLLSHSFWRRLFGRDPGVIGQTLNLNGRKTAIVGVMPEGFNFPLGTDVWRPLVLSAEEWNQREAMSLVVLGRLARGRSLAEARAAMRGVAERLEREFPANSGRGINVLPFLKEVTFGTRQFLIYLLYATTFLLLLGCANVTNLQLVKGASRRREIALRLTLGASRGRIVRQLLAESLLVAVASGLLGLLFARWGMQLIRLYVPQEIARFVVAGLDSVRMDGWVLTLALLATLASAVLAGVIPALRVSAPNLVEALREGGKGASGSLAVHRARRVLVVAQVTLALVLLVGAGLMVKGFHGLVHADLGFDPAGLLTFRVSLPDAKYPTGTQVAAFYERALERLAQIPGVASAATVSNLPAIGGWKLRGYHVEGEPGITPDGIPRVSTQAVSPGYFQAMRIPLKRGREISPGDSAGAAGVLVVSESFAHRHWPNAEATGRRIRWVGSEGGGDWLTVVGVVSDVSRSWIEHAPLPTLYVPLAQAPSHTMRFVVRTAGDPAGLLSAVRRAMTEVDREQALADVSPMTNKLANSSSGIRLAAHLMTVFALIGLVFAATGIYSLCAWAVVQRTHEIGIRVALGASRRDVVGLLMDQGMRLSVLGASLGLPLAYALTKVAASFLLGVVRVQASALAGLTVLLLLVAALASLFPALRALRIHPMQALRYE